MRILMFYQSLVSDWNHGNAHFLRGVVTELLERGHRVDVYEPQNSWSRQNLLGDYGPQALAEFAVAYPYLSSHEYELDELDFDQVLDGADLVIVHEWNEKRLVELLGQYRQLTNDFVLLFHDTHHKVANHKQSWPPFNLEDYDGILAYGAVLTDLYLNRGWASQAWTWHEAADTRIFHPHPELDQTEDMVWIGNWGDDERTAGLREFLIEPVKKLGITCNVYGVRYPHNAREELRAAGIDYCGWLANYKVPSVYARSKVTIHIPRLPYVDMLPGIPTIRPFEAMACGIPLICSPWKDVEQLFTPGSDFLVAENGAEMEKLIRQVLNEPELAQELAVNGLTTILDRHTCSHRVDELFAICEELKPALEIKQCGGD